MVQDSGNYIDFFRLQEGERIVHSIKPDIVLRKYWFVTSLFAWMFFAAFILPFFALLGGALLMIPIAILGAVGGGAVAALGGALIAIVSLLGILASLVVVPWWVSNKNYEHIYYWVTNKRIIEKRGLLGYSVNSIPLERISDVRISRSWLENVFGFGSLHIQSLAGQISTGKMGAEGNLLAVPEPEELQEQIFNLVKQKRKAEHLTM